jgi:SAP domain-containing ribonucleoprotein
MPEYAKMKNADLEALLKERGLTLGGKKADMVDRLTKDDEKKSSGTASADPKAAVSAEDEIDWDDDEPAKTAPAAADEVTTNEETVQKAGGEGQPPNPQAVPNQVTDIDPAKTDDLSVQPPAEGADPAPEEKKEPAPSYAQGLAATSIDDEIERRKKRALKFGMKIDEDEGLKKLERMKKFGEKGVKGLDEALPEREKKRGREDKDDAGANKRRDGGRPGRGGRGGGRRDDRRDDRNERSRRDSRSPRRERAPQPPKGLSDADRKAAEARKARFAAKPAA